MKEDRLLRALGDIDNDLIEDAGRSKTPIPFHRWASIAAAAVVLLAAVALPWGDWFAPAVSNAPTTTDTSTSGTERLTTTVTAGNEAFLDGVTTTMMGIYTTNKPTATAPVKVPEIALVPKWEEKTNNQKYPEIPYGAAMYSVYYTIDAKYVGETLTTVTATGQDVYTDTLHTTVTLYRLAEIAPQCAVAIQYEGDSAYYSAVATWYQPLTLGEFLDGLQLEKYGTFGSIGWDYYDGVYHYRTYSAVSKEVIFDLLLDDRSLPNVNDDRQHFVNCIDISVELPILGLKNPVVMMLSEDGYLFTNLLGCGKTFYIGTDRVEAFKDYLQKNCTYTVLAATTQAVTEPTDTQPPVTGTTTTKPAQPPHTSGAHIPE